MASEREKHPNLPKFSEALEDGLDAWKPALGEPRARVVTLPDGREVLQVRLELGILQMAAIGRPDGALIDGCPTVQQAMAKKEMSQLRAEENFPFAPISKLRLESAQLQRRAEAWLEARLPQRAILDVDLATQSIECAARCALAAEDLVALTTIAKAYFSLTALRVRAEAVALLAQHDVDGVRESIDKGLQRLQSVARDAQIADSFEFLSEVIALRAMRDNLVPKLPGSARTELEARLRAAVLSENYELAAILRDELRLS